MRLRQAVIAARELEPAVESLRSELGLGEPFRDPQVGEFGIENAVFAIGDCFLEVIAPLQDDTAAGRFLQRGGEGGYMVIFDLREPEPARARAADLGIRTIWRLDLPDISGAHLHPRDIGGAIVSIDGSRPYGSWRWAGPQWTAKLAEPAPGALRGVTLSVRDPRAVAERWARVLGARVHEDGQVPHLELEGSWVRFEQAGAEQPERVNEFALIAPGASEGPAARELLGVRLRLVGEAALSSSTLA